MSNSNEEKVCRSKKKLEDERQNLVRVNDILSELEKQVGPLERQSEKGEGVSETEGKIKNIRYQHVPAGNGTYPRSDSGAGRENFVLQKGELEEATRQYADTKDGI